MSKSQKPKAAKGTRNDTRPSGKAAKQNPGRKNSLEPVSPIFNILNGKGLYKKWERVVTGKSKGLPKTR